MTERWTPPTLRDHLREQPARGDAPPLVQLGLATPPAAEALLRAPVRCPGLPGRRCYRSVDPQMMVDVRSLPVEVRGATEFACDGCMEVLRRDEYPDRAAFARALGAPAEVVARLEAKARGRVDAEQAGR